MTVYKDSSHDIKRLGGGQEVLAPLMQYFGARPSSGDYEIQDPAHRSDAQLNANEGTDGFDILGVIRRYPKVLGICLLVSTLIASLYYLKTPKVYESFVDILVEPKKTTAFSTESMMENQTAHQKHLATHTYSLTSPIILERVLAKLGKIPTLNDAERPLEALSECLEVESGEAESDVVTLRGRGVSREDSYQMVSTVVDCYEEFLEETSEDIGKKTTSLINQAKDDLMVQLQDREKTYREFQQNAPLIWQDGKGVNTHHERQLQVEKARSELAIQQTELSSRIEGLAKTLEEPDGIRVAYFDAVTKMLEHNKDPSSGNADQVVDRENARVLSNHLMELQAEEDRLSLEFGHGHPDLAVVRQRIERVQSKLAETDSDLMRLSMMTADPEKMKEYVAVYASMLTRNLDNVELQIAKLDASFAEEQEKANGLQAFVLQDEALQQDMERTQQLFDAVVARLEEINIVREHGGDRIRVMATPQLGEQVSPTLLKAAALAFGLSIFSGMGITYLMDISDASFHSLDEVTRTLRRPILGTIPRLDDENMELAPGFEQYSSTLITMHRSSSNVSEAFRAIRTALFFSGENHKVIQLTSPLPGDGKSTIAANLATTVALAGKRVLLIDADFRKPTLHELFGRPKYSEYGLAELVSKRNTIKEADLQTAVDNLFVLNCGERPTNPSEVLTSPEFSVLIDELRNQFDLIIIDSPPVLAVTDPTAIAARVDGVILALRVRRGSRAAATRACELLSKVDAKILGIVVNAIERKGSFSGGSFAQSYGYGYGYGYGYNSEEYSELNERQLTLQS